jgi:hypothetical protein
MKRGIPGDSTIYREASDGKLKAAMSGSLKTSPRKPEREPERPSKPVREPEARPLRNRIDKPNLHM